MKSSQALSEIEAILERLNSPDYLSGEEEVKYANKLEALLEELNQISLDSSIFIKILVKLPALSYATKDIVLGQLKKVENTSKTEILAECAKQILSNEEDEDKKRLIYQYIGHFEKLTESDIAILKNAIASEKNLDLKEIAAETLIKYPQAGYNLLREMLLSSEARVRQSIVNRFDYFYHTFPEGKDGIYASMLLTLAIEDPDGNIAAASLINLKLNLSNSSELDILVEPIIDFICNELLIRPHNLSNTRFNQNNTKELLLLIFVLRPHSQKIVLQELVKIAFRQETSAWERSVDLARELFPVDFSNLVKTKSLEEPEATSKIMDRIGGVEATSFFSRQQLHQLEKYQKPLNEIEQIALNRWHSLTKQSNLSLWINVALSVGMFVVGVGVIIWGMILVSTSSELAQQITGGFLAGISAMLTTLSGKLWKDPVQHIQYFSAQQARLQIAFIGFFNRVAELRLQFEEAYAKGELTTEDTTVYQKLLSDAIQQASDITGASLPKLSP